MTYDTPKVLLLLMQKKQLKWLGLNPDNAPDCCVLCTTGFNNTAIGSLPPTPNKSLLLNIFVASCH